MIKVPQKEGKPLKFYDQPRLPVSKCEQCLIGLMTGEHAERRHFNEWCAVFDAAKFIQGTATLAAVKKVMREVIEATTPSNRSPFDCFAELKDDHVPADLIPHFTEFVPSNVPHNVGRGDEVRDELRSVWSNLEAGVRNQSTAIIELRDQIVNNEARTHRDVDRTEITLATVLKSIGDDKDVPIEIASTSVFGVISRLFEHANDECGKLEVELAKNSQNLQRKLEDSSAFSKAAFEAELIAHKSEMDKKISDLRDLVVRVCESLNREVERKLCMMGSGGGMSQAVSSITTSSAQSYSQPGIPPGSVVLSGADFEDIKDRLAKVEDRADDFDDRLAHKSSDVMGPMEFRIHRFESMKELKAWIKNNVGDALYGRFLDIYGLAERVLHVAPTDLNDILTQQEKSKKLNIESAAEAIVLSALSREAPALFEKVPKSKFMGKQPSYLGNIPSWEAWDAPHVGVRAVIETRVPMVKQAVLSDLKEVFMRGSPKRKVAYTLASDMIHSTISWLTGLKNFIDRTYGKCKKNSKFTDAQAWSLTSRLVASIFEEIFKVRGQYVVTTKTANQNEIFASALAAAIRTLGVMEEFELENFERHDAVNSEYIQYLSMNTGHEALENFQVTVSSIQKDASELKKGQKEQSGSLSTFHNKLDEHIKATNKRLAALEKNK